jgi:hypothetical protein
VSAAPLSHECSAEKRLATVQARLALRGFQIRPCGLHGSYFVFGVTRARHCAEVEDVERFADELEEEALR